MRKDGLGNKKRTKKTSKRERKKELWEKIMNAAEGKKYGKHNQEGKKKESSEREKKTMVEIKYKRKWRPLLPDKKKKG